MALSIAWWLTSLTGCNKAPAFEDTRHLEKPPPKPPNCPDSPDLKNIMLSDGTIVGVRIIQILNTKLYVPATWMEAEFIDKSMRDSHGFIRKEYLGRYVPDIHSIQCPGIVHKFNENSDIYIIGFNFIDRIKHKSQKNISLESDIDGVILAPISKKNTLSSASANAWLDPSTNPLTELEVRTNIPSNETFGPVVKIQSQSINAFLQWLATPPAKRDNDREFTLKIDKS